MLWTLLFACTPDKEPEAACQPGDLDASQALATLDGEAWEGGGTTWLMAGSSLQINTTRSSGWTLSLIAQHTADGTTLDEALAAGDFPIEVTLLTGEEGGWATMLPEEGLSFTTKETAGGSLTLSEQDDVHLRGCFAFEVAGDDGAFLVEEGTFDAVPSTE